MNKSQQQNALSQALAINREDANVNRDRRSFAAMLTSVAAGVALAPKGARADDEVEISGSNRKSLRFDVAENGTRFVFDETPLHADGKGAYGNEFVTEGFIYPFGTLNGSNGVTTDGKAEFAPLVIGRWTCRGWHVGDGAKTVTGPWVITHQLFDLGSTFGAASLTTDGYELVDVNVPIARAITGGTGPYRMTRGESVQTMLGFNATAGAVLRVIFDVKRHG